MKNEIKTQNLQITKLTTLFAVLILIFFTAAKISAQNIHSLKKTNIFAFLPDIHYAHAGKLSDGGTSWGLKEEGLIALVDYLQKQNLDFVVLGGDFCNIDSWFTNVNMISDAHDAFERVKTEFSRLKVPIYYLRGNHETYLAKVNGVRNKTNEFYGDKLYRYHCGYGSAKATYYDFDCGGWKFIVLDSGGMIGTIEPAQMSWLKDVLKKTDASTPIILFIHGPLYPFFGDSPESTKLVTNYKAVIDAFKDKALKLVLQGHLHKNELREVIQINSSGKPKKIYFKLTGAAFLMGNDPPNPGGGFNIIETVGENFTVSKVMKLSEKPVIDFTNQVLNIKNK